MTAINHFNLRNFDLNLLIAFDALMRDRSVTRAANRLKVGQPAMSHSLGTLRMLFDDELFVRVGHRMEPTAKAEMLARHVLPILQQSQQLLGARAEFDPQESVRTFNIGFFSEELLVLPQLAALLVRLAPGIRLMARRVSSADLAGALDNGTLDLAVGCTPPVSARFRQDELFEQTLVCCYHPAQMTLDAPLDLAAWHAARHVFVAERDATESCLGSMLVSAGHPLNVVLGTPDYLSLLAIVAESPVLATLPAQVAQRYAPRFGLLTLPAPCATVLPPVRQIWAAASDADAGLAWLRRQIKAVCLPSDADRLQ